jgi:enterobacteria phage integrase
MLRILIAHAMSLDATNPCHLEFDPSRGIKRPKTKEFRAWSDRELAVFERRWPVGTKQRTAYALMRYLGTARADVHKITWSQFDLTKGAVGYVRSKTGVRIETDVSAR